MSTPSRQSLDLGWRECSSLWRPHSTRSWIACRSPLVLAFWMPWTVSQADPATAATASLDASTAHHANDCRTVRRSHLQAHGSVPRIRSRGRPACAYPLHQLTERWYWCTAPPCRNTRCLSSNLLLYRANFKTKVWYCTTGRAPLQLWLIFWHLPAIFQKYLPSIIFGFITIPTDQESTL